MAFCQLGFWPAGEVNNDPVYLILLLAPVAMGAVAFGPVTGALLGLFGGLVAFAHATILPLDFLEGYYFGTPISSVGLFTFVGLVAGVLFDLALRRDPQGGKRVALIIAVSIVVAKITTAGPQEHYTYCELADWEREGLLKPSRVQVAPLFQLAQSDLLNGEPLGMLTERDRRVLSLMLMPEDDGIGEDGR